MQNNKPYHHGISQSALSVFRECPFAYSFYRQKKDAIFFNFDVLDTGRYTHEAINQYYRNYYLTKASVDDILALSYSSLKNIWDTTLPAEELYKSFICLKNHAEFESKNINNGANIKPLTEIDISHDIFYGIIDYIDLPNKKVIDWKTNKSAVISFEYRMQAYVYKVLYEYQFKDTLDKFMFFFLFPNEIKTIKYDDKGMIKAVEEVNLLQKEMSKAIKENVFEMKPRTESTCTNCRYRLYCKY